MSKKGGSGGKTKGTKGKNKEEKQQQLVLQSLIDSDILVLSKEKVSLAKPYLNRLLETKAKTSDEMLEVATLMLIEHQKTVSEDDLVLSISVVGNVLEHFGLTETNGKGMAIPKEEDEGVDYMSMF